MMPMPTDPAPAVACRTLGKTFPGRRAVVALDGVDLDLRPGTVTALVGPSGCGKSTLLRIVAGLDKPSAGTVTVDGADPSDLRARGQIAVAFQDASLLPWRSVASNVALARRLARLPRDPGRVQRLIELVGLAGFESAKPAQLSGGMRQRAAIARCLVTEPRLLLLDEPFGAVDELTRRRLNLELPATWQDTKPTTLLVTHSVPEAVLLSDEVVVMTDRPGAIAAHVPVDIERPRRAHHLHTDAFHALVDQVGDLLGVDRDLDRDRDPKGDRLDAAELHGRESGPGVDGQPGRREEAASREPGEPGEPGEPRDRRDGAAEARPLDAEAGAWR
jgi:NitT/TauT family transport system ATP-binding protein